MRPPNYLAPLFLVLAAWLAASSSIPTSAPIGRVTRAASMHAKRADHTATLLRDGRVLITGGMVENGVFLASAELFDPAKQTFVPVANMHSPRVGHSATLLPNGKVLIAGGLAGRISEGGTGVVASTEIFDPATGQFTAGPSMTTPRTGHGAVLLANQKVLIAGGTAADDRELASAEIYDPATNKFTATGSMHTARIARPAIRLLDGRVLVCGGGNGLGPAVTAAEVFDPASGRWTQVGNMTSPREKHAAALLPDGRVLIAGGSPDGQWHAITSAEIFDPHTNTFTAANAMEAARFKIPDAAVALKDGRILAAGGAEKMEVYDPATKEFAIAGNVSEPHYFASATRLADGRVLITGGYTPSPGRANGPLSSDGAWIYQP